MTGTPGELSTTPVRRSGPRSGAAADQTRLIRRYLSAIETSRPGRAARRAQEAVTGRITKVDELLVSADPLTRVHLTQERIELHTEQVRLGNGSPVDLSALERDFVRVVRSYSDRHGLTYAAWRQVGVATDVLDRAGIHRADRKPLAKAPPKSAGTDDRTAAAVLPEPPSATGAEAAPLEAVGSAPKAPAPEAPTADAPAAEGDGRGPAAQGPGLDEPPVEAPTAEPVSAAAKVSTNGASVAGAEAATTPLSAGDEQVGDEPVRSRAALPPELADADADAGPGKPRRRTARPATGT